MILFLMGFDRKDQYGAPFWFWSLFPYLPPSSLLAAIIFAHIMVQKGGSHAQVYTTHEEGE